MPDDPIFDTESAEETTESTETTEETTEASSKDSTTASPPADAATEARLARMEQAMTSMGTFFQQLQNRLAEQQGQPQNAPDPSQDKDWAQRFYDDPEGTVKRTAEELMSGVVGPAANTLGDVILNEQRTAIDSKWGAGAWEAHVAPTLQPVIDEARRTNPAQLLNKSALENAVGTVVARHVDALLEHRESHKKADDPEALVKQVTERVLSSTNLTGGLRRSNGDAPKLDADQKAVLKALQADTGETRDENLLAVLMDTGDAHTGTTLEQYEAAVKRASGGK